MNTHRRSDLAHRRNVGLSLRHETEQICRIHPGAMEQGVGICGFSFLLVRRIHPGGMKESSRGSKRSETPGPATAWVCIPEGCQSAVQPRRACFWHPLPGCRTLLSLDRGSPLRCDPQLPSGNPPGCTAAPQPHFEESEFASSSGDYELLARAIMGTKRP
jgi:hypothetical protein